MAASAVPALVLRDAMLRMAPQDEGSENARSPSSARHALVDCCYGHRDSGTVDSAPSLRTSHMTTKQNLPLLGVAVPLSGLRQHRGWILEKQRDLELQDFFWAEVLNGDWKPLAAEIRGVLDGYRGRLGIHGPFWGFNIAT